MPPRWKEWQERWRDPALTGLLVVQTVILFVLRPVAVMIDAGHERWEPLAAATATACQVGTFLLMLLALLVVSRRRRAVALILVSIGIAAGALLAGQWGRLPHSRDVALAGSFLFTLTMGWVIARAVFGAGAVTYHRITGAIVLYFAMAEIFASLYQLVLVFAPDSLSGLNIPSHLGFLRTETALREQLIYFSFSALTTASFGDILPTHPLTKSLANLESVLGQMFPATLLARIVTLEIEARRSRRREG